LRANRLTEGCLRCLAVRGEAPGPRPPAGGIPGDRKDRWICARGLQEALLQEMEGQGACTWVAAAGRNA